ncbi:MAG: hypothetical protein ACYTEL_03510 [Planctomycetota bacterium]|jgi:hypothetical protein
MFLKRCPVKGMVNHMRTGNWSNPMEPQLKEQRINLIKTKADAIANDECAELIIGDTVILCTHSIPKLRFDLFQRSQYSL